MKMFIQFVFIALLFGSCSRYPGKGIEADIKNNSNGPIKYLKIYTSERLGSLSYNLIRADNQAKDFLNMNQNKIDGNYTIEFIRASGKKEQINAGYYTNGSPLETHMQVEIENDTTIVSFCGIPFPGNILR